ncbi:MAG: protein kinase, partial [Pyrinomonadaceae bacterium]
DGNVAYLVMEYLDGCTLGEVLEEEKHLPVSWTIDILEQVCSAVQEAHHQGIIHRDLKPDNIWLEPNQRGGYTVKVLDFGIAKLETHESSSEIRLPEDLEEIVKRVSGQTVLEQSGTIKNTLIGGGNSNTTFAGNKDLTAVSDSETISDDGKGTAIVESKTLIQNEPNEAGTLFLPDLKKTETVENDNTLIQSIFENENTKTAIVTPAESNNSSSNEFTGTKLHSTPELDSKSVSLNSKTDKKDLQEATTSELTRIGAVLGTPLYMSPEQCRGEHLTPQSDIYSLAVIAYQMLDGKTPFEGNFTDVMESHKAAEPPPLTAKKVPQRLKKHIIQAMSKNPEERPKDAEAFASVLKAQSEGLGSLYRQAIALYGKHLPKFLLISVLIFLPIVLLSIIPMIFKLFQYFGMLESVLLNVVGGISTGLSTFAGFFFGAIGYGTMTLLVSRNLSAPLRPLDLRGSFQAVRQRWKPILGWVSLTSILSLAGLAFCFVPGVYLASRFAFVTPAIVMENLPGRAAIKRSNELFKRSPWKIFILSLANFILPIFIAMIVLSFIIAVVGNIKSDNQFLRGMGSRPTDEAVIKKYEDEKLNGKEKAADRENIQVSVGSVNAPNVSYDTTDEPNDSSKDTGKETLSKSDKYARGAGQALRDLLYQIIYFPIVVLITSFTQILMALMYIKTRQAGGEPMRDLLKQFEDDDKPQTKWQKRIQKRLLQSGRMTGKTSTK